MGTRAREGKRTMHCDACCSICLGKDIHAFVAISLRMTIAHLNFHTTVLVFDVLFFFVCHGY